MANLLITVVKRKVKCKWTFSNLVPVTRQQLVNDININFSLGYAKESWLKIVKKKLYQNFLFSKRKGAYF